MSTTPRRRPHAHSLLRGGRWHPARPGSRALWTSAGPIELADLSDDAGLRARIEDLLRLASSVLEDIDALLVFDQECAQLVASVSLSADGRGYRWSWVWPAREHDASAAR